MSDIRLGAAASVSESASSRDPVAASKAWILDFGGGSRAAVGGRHMIEFILSPEVIGFPLTPSHCLGLLVWRDRILPVIDPARWLRPEVMPADAERRRAVVLAYQEKPGQALGYGTLIVHGAPAELWVSDDMVCPIPDEPVEISSVALSCFAYDGRAVPILNVAQLFCERL